MRRGAVGAAAVAVILAVVGVIVFAVRDQQRWEAWCTGQGGHVDRDTRTYWTTTWSNGRSHQSSTTSTTYYCRTPAGGILDTR